MQAYEQYINTLKKWLWIEDEQGIDIIIATAVAVFLPGDPIWTFVVDPPGALKTELCRSLAGPRIYSVDSLTPESLISGLKSGKNIDILPDLDGKLLVIKDFTTILNKPERTRDELFGRLRAAYDGYLEQAYGSGVKRKAFRARFGILAAVTPAIDSYVTVHALLGERFIRVKTRYDREKAVELALDHTGKEEQMRAEIRRAAVTLLTQCEQLASQTVSDPPDKQKIGVLGDVVAVLRTPVARDYRHEVVAMPEAEVGTRLGKQLFRLGQALNVFGRYDYQTLVRCGRDCITPARLAILNFLGDSERKTTDIETIGFTRHIIRNELQNLHLLGVLNYREDPASHSYYYKIEPKFLAKLKEAEIL